MDALLQRARAALAEYDFYQPPPDELPALADALDSAAASNDAVPQPVAHLPEEILLRLAELLRIGPACIADAEDLDAEATLQSERLLRHAPSLLRLARPLARMCPTPPDPPPREALDLRARLFIAFGRFTQRAFSESFTTPPLRALAAETTSHLLRRPPHVRLPLLRHVLTSHFPRYFKPHPKLNPSTGRVLNRPLGGEAGTSAWHEDGEEAGGWRREAGLAAVVTLVIQGLEPGEIEDVWPLLLPPLLSYLDDYDPAHKILGLSILDSLLKGRVDAALLRRTGVGKVFEQSLSSCFSALSHPLSAQLLASAHPVALELVRLLHPASSSSSPQDDEARFNALSTLVSTSVVAAWEFKAGHVAIETVSARALRGLVSELGAGCVRWLQVVVPHLCDLLEGSAGAGTSPEVWEMRIEAAWALRGVVEQARVRMGRWEARVVGAVGRCWVEIREEDEARTRTSEERDEVRALEEALRGVVRALDEVSRREDKASCLTMIPPASAPSEVLIEGFCWRKQKSLVADLRALDEGLFGDLVGPGEVMAQ
ncbi:hypothetical protein JCM1840_007345 [Sporobolomyces johnsonii]